MEKNKVVFLDRDGTINIDYGYVYEKEKLVFVDGVIDGLKKLQEFGFKLIIVTNQSGIGRGYYTLEECNKFNEYLIEKLKEQNINISKVYVCPHKDEDNCNCRKPKLSLFYQAIDEFNIDLDNSFAIGDNIRDLKICDETNIKGILLFNQNDRYISKKSFKESIDYITNEES